MGKYFTSWKFYSASHHYVTSWSVTAALTCDDVVISRFLQHRITSAIKLVTTMPVVSLLWALSMSIVFSLINSTDSADFQYQVLLLVWLLQFGLSGKRDPTRNWSFNQHSPPGHWSAQAHVPRHSESPQGEPYTETTKAQPKARTEASNRFINTAGENFSLKFRL